MPKISQFPAGGSAQNTDLIPVVRNGGDYTVTGYNLASLASYGQAYVGTFTATAGQTVFTLPASPGSLANLFISVDGAVMVPGSDYTWTTPVTLTFAVGLKVGQTVLYNYTTSVPIGTSLAGGVSGQVQYNNSGVLNGTTIGGDATLVATTGALTVTKTAGVAFAASATTNTTLTGNINYTQGGTGSVTRTVTNKLQELVSVKDFGAVGDGVTDDTAAIQAAVNYLATLGDGKLNFPPASVSYYFREISVASRMAIDLGKAACKLVPTKVGSYHAFFVVTAADVTIQNGVFDGNLSAQSADLANIDLYAAIYAVGADRLQILNNRITNTYANGAIRIRDGSDVLVFGNMIDTTGIGATYAAQAMYYNVTGTRQNFRVNLSSNACNGGGIGINDDLATQYLFGWLVSNNQIVSGTYTNASGIGTRATDGIIQGNHVRWGGSFGITASVGAGLRAQNLLNVTGNILENTTGAYSAYGIEHYGIDINIVGNVLKDCAITSTGGTDGNITITGNTLRTTLGVSYINSAISFGVATYNGITISGNSCNGFGTFVACSTTAANWIAISGNNVNLANITSSQFFAWTTNSAVGVTASGVNITGNVIQNCQRGYVYFAGLAAGLVTVDRLRVSNNTLDSNSYGLTSYNASFTNSINSPNNDTPTSLALAYSATIATTAIRSNLFTITATNGTAFTISNPTDGYSGQVITYVIRNTSGGALGALTFGAAFKASAWTQPATGYSRSISFRYDGTNWVETVRSSADVPN